ncbi:MAG: iron-containing alcohol dehydrogenase, partial [Clostridia bacterium]|nr:iron-containing alcohol dehydrogenase [Clostridia bacterium]
GGGSAMDCAKGVGISVVYPNKSLEKFKGILKVHKKIPTLVAIPTTAGTGSECTVATVLTNEKTHQKYAINDLHLIPRYAVLAPELTQGLPAFLTATTGMDALTHAIEAFIGRGNTKQTTAWAKEAVQLVFENIKIACQNGSDLVARAKMQKASYLAGLAFTRAYVGYVHAVAHSLGGRYNVAHGLANAVILPYVLKRYSTSVYDKLAILADCCKLCPNGTAKEKATAFIEEIEQLNKELGIGTKFYFIQKEDIPYLATLADKEANPLYPVPKLMDKKELEKIYFDLIP